MIHQTNMYGKDKVQIAIERFQTFEPPEGYYLAFSGGKDSVVLKALADMAGVKYDAHYNVTTVDPPELVQFIKEYHKDVIFEKAHYKDGRQKTMWNLIEKKKMPPTRLIRYCCQELKEHGGDGRFTVTGVRWAESTRRRKNRGGLELQGNEARRELLDPDNPENERLARFCPTKGKHILNPIIDWDDDDIWEFIREYKIPYCKLYDKGWTRLGCIGCPMSTRQKQELEKYPKIKNNYLKAFERMLKRIENNTAKIKWKTAQDVFDWWIGEAYKDDGEQIGIEEK